MRRALFLAVLALGCVHSRGFRAPDGSLGYVIKCNGYLNSMAACLDRAFENCGGPYRIVTGKDDQRLYYFGDPVIVDHREVMVLCDSNPPPTVASKQCNTDDECAPGYYCFGSCVHR